MIFVEGLVSIIMPVFNVEQFVEKSVNSILNQTYHFFELIIVDDGWTDFSVKRIKDCIGNDGRVKIFQKENGGLSDARNYGLDKASGTFVYFIDSDDWIEPQLIQRCVDEMKKAKSNCVVFGYFHDILNKEGNLICQHKIFVENTVLHIYDRDVFFDEVKIGLLGYAWNKMYSRGFIEEKNIRFVKGVSLVEDILFNLEVFKNSHNIVFLRDQLYHYISRPVETLISKYHSNGFDLCLLKNERLNCFLDSWKIKYPYKNVILANSFVTGIRYCINNLFVSDKTLAHSYRVTQIHNILNNGQTKRLIHYYTPQSFNDRAYKLMIKYKMTYVIYLICLLKK